MYLTKAVARFCFGRWITALSLFTLVVHSLATDFDLSLKGSWPGHSRGDVRAVTMVNTYAYVAAGEVGLFVIDISKPVKPKWLGAYDTGGSATGVAVSGNYAYVADG